MKRSDNGTRKAAHLLGEPGHCDDCGRRYNRRNKVEAWVQQNQGHRKGWLKKVRKICTYCGPAPIAKKMLFVAARVS